jgi:hypothetical protein
MPIWWSAHWTYFGNGQRDFRAEWNGFTGALLRQKLKPKFQESGLVPGMSVWKQRTAQDRPADSP